jgi:hypothetical protein
VVWTGIIIGSWLTVEALKARVGLTFLLSGLVPSAAAIALNVLLVWGLLVLAATLGTGALKRHHRVIAGKARSGGAKAVAVSVRHGRRHGGRLGRWLTSTAAATLQALRSSDDSEAAEPAPTRRVDGKPETDADTRFFDLRESGYTGPVDQDGHAVVTRITPTGGDQLTTTSRSKIEPDRRGARAAARAGGKIPGEWGPVVAQAADFEAENDGHLLDWMAGQVAGMGAYAEALIDAYETGVNATGIDPKGLAALHDVADAAAHAAETMGGARTKFADHYELPREFAANGGLMTHDGRWVTGEGG